MDKIYFTKQEFEKIWNNLAFLGRASEGTCKRLNNKEAIKYLDGPYVNLNEEQILMFKDIKNKTYLFPYRTFYIDGSHVGEEDTQKLSDKGISTYDILFNILYKNGVFHIIDTCEYKNVDTNNEKLYKDNISSFNYSLLEFLVKDRFYKFVFTSKELRELYEEAENGESIIPFLERLRQRLCEYCDEDVKSVIDAKKAMTLCHKSVYPEYF